MTARKIWDISQRIGRNTPLWPGEPDIALTRHAEIGPECPVNVGALFFPLHTGTHADAPFHYSNQGVSSANSPLDAYLGECVVVDVRHCANRVEVADCDWNAIEQAKRVLFQTYHEFPHDKWDSNFASISPDVIARLRDAGTILVGTDAPSLDPETSKTMDAHKEILKGDMRILEGLVLQGISPGVYELIALPLAIEGADASPVRAVLREISQ